MHVVESRNPEKIRSKKYLDSTATVGSVISKQA